MLILCHLHKVLQPFLLCQLKKDIESELPDKVEIEKVIKCKMSGLQYQLYQQMKKYGILFDEEVKGWVDIPGLRMVGCRLTISYRKQTGIKGLNNTIMQFCKICQHPFVFPQIEDHINASRNVNMSIICLVGKVVLLDQLLLKLFKTGHQVCWLSPISIPYSFISLGSHLLPNDKCYGHLGWLLPFLRFQALLPWWVNEAWRACYSTHSVQRSKHGHPPVHAFHPCRWSRSEFADCCRQDNSLVPSLPL